MAERRERALDGGRRILAAPQPRLGTDREHLAELVDRPAVWRELGGASKCRDRGVDRGIDVVATSERGPRAHRVDLADLARHDLGMDLRSAIGVARDCPGALARRARLFG